MTPRTFVETLCRWQRDQGRHHLPWQKNRTAYRVWISEIMLQQTQVSTVIPYFNQFMTHFPDISTLAEAPLEQVMHLWSGLGYYRRGQFIHEAAAIIDREHGGRFPRRYEQVLGLPGIGRSTAGAIMSLAYKQPYPILDGNVKRVLARFHGIEEDTGQSAVQKRLWTLAEIYVRHAADPACYTQALMDLGAGLCGRQPECPRCPLRAGCAAKKAGKQLQIPVKAAAKAKPRRRACLLLLHDEHRQVLLEKRPPTGIWPNLWSLPQSDDQDTAVQWLKNMGLQARDWQPLPARRHEFTHFRLQMEPIAVRVSKMVKTMEPDTFIWYKKGQSVAIATPVKKILADFFVWLKGVET